MPLLCHYFVLTTYWLHIWSITEQTCDNIHGIYLLNRLYILKCIAVKKIGSFFTAFSRPDFLVIPQKEWTSQLRSMGVIEPSSRMRLKMHKKILPEFVHNISICSYRRPLVIIKITGFQRDFNLIVDYQTARILAVALRTPSALNSRLASSDLEETTTV